MEALTDFEALIERAKGAIGAVVKEHQLDLGDGVKIRVVSTPAVPEGEIQFRDRNGKLLVRLVNVGKGG